VTDKEEIIRRGRTKSARVFDDGSLEELQKFLQKKFNLVRVTQAQAISYLLDQFKEKK
jgi:hypothetical protein